MKRRNSKCGSALFEGLVQLKHNHPNGARWEDVAIVAGADLEELLSNAEVAAMGYHEDGRSRNTFRVYTPLRTLVFVIKHTTEVRTQTVPSQDKIIAVPKVKLGPPSEQSATEFRRKKAERFQQGRTRKAS